MSPREGRPGEIRRGISRWVVWWGRLPLIGALILIVVRGVAGPLPGRLVLLVLMALVIVCLALAGVTPPESGRPPVRVGAPVRGRWVAFSSPGQAVPSHGTRAYGQAYAVDLGQLRPGAALCEGWSLRGGRPEDYPCFGQPVLAVGPGRVVAASSSQRDHRSRSTWPLLAGMILIEGAVRQLAGVGRILGNHVIIEHEGDRAGAYYSLYAHLRQGSVSVGVGERVEEGQQLAQVGNTGHSSEPHLHIHLMDRPRPERAAGVPWLFPWGRGEGLLRDPRLPERPPKRTAMPGMPTNGQILRTPGSFRQFA